MRRALQIILILAAVFSAPALADSEADLQRMIDAGYLPANADGKLAGEEPVDRRTLAHAIAMLLAEISENAPEVKEELLRNLTVQLQAELATLSAKTKEVEESLSRLEEASSIAKDELVNTTAQSQKLSADLQASQSKLEGLAQKLADMEQVYKTLQGEIEGAKQTSEAAFKRQGDLLSELETRASTLRRETGELADLVHAVEQRSVQLGGQLETTEAALYENVNKLQLDLASNTLLLRATEDKLQLTQEQTSQQLASLREELAASQAKIAAQKSDFVAYQNQSNRWSKLALSVGAVIVPVLLLMIY